MNRICPKSIFACLIVIIFLGILNTATYAIDNPDAPDYIAEFKNHEISFVDKINNPKNTNQDYLSAFNDYMSFLDKELNVAYKLLLSKLNEEGRDDLIKSQRQWIKFRDTEFEFIRNNWTRKNFGSSASVSQGDYRTSIVRERVIQLLNYVRNY